MASPAAVPLATSVYDPDCRRCPRLAHFLDEVKHDHPGYFCKPVPPFGAAHPRLIVVGLAPGLHGANATGRPFTGDWCGPLLYSSLHRFGFASASESRSVDDGLKLIDCRITNAVKCLPPQNKPERSEVRNCTSFLGAELAEASQLRVLLTLGTVAHQAVLDALRLRLRDYPFAHHRRHQLTDALVLFNSYHVSRYNTQTGRLTEAMFHSVLADIRKLLDS